MICLRFLDFRSIAAMEASSARIRELVREREVMRRTVVRRYGCGSGGGGGRGGEGPGGVGGEGEEDGGGAAAPPPGEDADEPEAAAPGEAPRQPIRGLPLTDDAPTPAASSLLWKRMGLALSSGFEQEEARAAGGAGGAGGGAGAAAPPSLSLIADALAASSTDQPEEHVSNVLSPRSRPRRRWEPCAYWSSTGSADARSGEALSFRLAHPLCVATAVTVRPFAAHFQPGRPIYAPRSVQLASGRSDLWSEGLVREWERGRERGQQREGGAGGAAPAPPPPSSSPSPPSPPPGVERFIATDERGLSEARTHLVVEERRRAHPPGYPRFDGAFLRDPLLRGSDGSGDGSGGAPSPSWAAAVSRALPVRKSGRAQRLSLLGEEEAEGGGGGGGGGAGAPPSPSRQRRARRLQSTGAGRARAGAAAAAAAAGGARRGAAGEALLVTGGLAALLLRGRTQEQAGVDDLYYTCLSYAKVHGFAVRGLRVEFRARPPPAAAAAAAPPPPPPTTAGPPRPVPVLTRIPEGRDPLFDVIPGGLAAVSERGRAASRAARRRRALSAAGRLFSLGPAELSAESARGTRALAEALVATADDSASDGEGAAFRELVGGGGEEGEEEENGGGGGGDSDGDGHGHGGEGGGENGEAETALFPLLSGLLWPDGSAFPREAAMRMVRMLAAAFARRGEARGGSARNDGSVRNDG